MAPNGIEPPCFGLIANALLDHLRYEAACHAITEPFMREVSIHPGMRDAIGRQQQKLVLMAEAQRLFAAMAPHEDVIRKLFSPEEEPRKISAAIRSRLGYWSWL